MIKLNPDDGHTKVVLPSSVNLLELLQDSEDAAKVMNFKHDLRCFCNYMIAHYNGFWNEQSTKFYVSYPLRKL